MAQLVSRPKVSVFMPAYNHALFLAEAIESALGQDYENLEIIVGDDYSSDGSTEIARRFAMDHPGRVRLLESDRNLGMVANFNRTLAACDGEYIAFTSGDDAWRPGRVSRQVALMEANPGMVLCCGRAEVAFDDGSGRSSFVAPAEAPRLPAESTIDLLFDLGLAACTLMARRSAVPAGGYDPRVPLSADWLFFIQVLRHGEFGFVDEVLGKYRLHQENSSRRWNDEIWVDYVVTMQIVARQYPELRAKAVRKRRELLEQMFVEHHLTTNDQELNERVAAAAMRVAPLGYLFRALGRETVRRIRARLGRSAAG